MKKPSVVTRAKPRIPSSSLFGISEIKIVQKIKYPITINSTFIFIMGF